MTLATEAAEVLALTSCATRLEYTAISLLRRAMGEIERLEALQLDAPSEHSLHPTNFVKLYTSPPPAEPAVVEALKRVLRGLRKRELDQYSVEQAIEAALRAHQEGKG